MYNEDRQRKTEMEKTKKAVSLISNLAKIAPKFSILTKAKYYMFLTLGILVTFHVYETTFYHQVGKNSENRKVLGEWYEAERDSSVTLKKLADELR
jgi:hypothetical protein